MSDPKKRDSESQEDEEVTGDPYDPFKEDKKENRDLQRGFEPINPDDFSDE
jgi:hypothetical protein